LIFPFKIARKPVRSTGMDVWASVGRLFEFERTMVSILMEPIKNEPGFHPNKQFPVLTNSTILTDLAILNY
jgi:hypothetical protein